MLMMQNSVWVSYPEVATTAFNGSTNETARKGQAECEKSVINAAVRTARGQYEEIGRGGAWTFLSPLVEAQPEQRNAVLKILL
jgi:hypothetical protein